MTRDTVDHFQQPDRGRFGDNEQRSDQVEKSNLVDLHFYLRNDNPSKKAIGVSADRQTPFKDWIWLPRSRIEYHATGSIRGTPTVRVTLPEPLAKEKGLI